MVNLLSRFVNKLAEVILKLNVNMSLKINAITRNFTILVAS